MGVQDGDSSHRSIASTTGQTDAARGTWSAGAVAVSLLSSLSHWLGSAVAVRTEMQGQKKDSASWGKDALTAWWTAAGCEEGGDEALRQ